MKDITDSLMKQRPMDSLSGMASIAYEYCQLIENLETNPLGDTWIQQMGQLLPKLHAAIVMLDTPQQYSYTHHLENDDIRCELFMRLNEFFLSDQTIWPDFDKYDLKLHMCESLAYDFTDMYFDLKRGLDLLDLYPHQPNHAASNWRSSFFYHWGRQLVDAEGWLYAVGLRDSNSSLAELSSFKTA
ncbi:MAG: DUF5063 domain-containing protein [Gammaproteobacteria bacterium]|nr:DUF5063 domain-containing protein [Gammaproteobacteria bacterium]